MTPTSKLDTTLILYPPGAYGTFLEWGLTYFSGGIDNHSPFTNTGSAHKFTGHPLHIRGGKSTIDWYFASDYNFPFCRCHGGDLHKGSAQDVALKYGPLLKKIIFVNPDLPLLVTHNKINKITKQHVPQLENLDVWEQREHLSFWLNDEMAFHKLLVTESTPNVLTVNLSNFINNPAGTFLHLINYFGLPLVNWDKHPKIFNEWLRLQTHKNKDQLCNNIVNSLFDSPIEWDVNELTLLDEAYIQKELRRLHNIELKCYNLNSFPTSTTELKKYLA